MATVSGGDKLEKYLKNLSKRITSGGTLKVGFLEGGPVYPDGMSVAEVATIQEYGSPVHHIPARPFMRQTVLDREKEWPIRMAKLIVANDYDGRKALDQFGKTVVVDIKESILDVESPPLSPVTIAIRAWKAKNPGQKPDVEAIRRSLRNGNTPDLSGASTKPLIDTYKMINSVAYKVTGS